jgi:L-fucose dehydrogenase
VVECLKKRLQKKRSRVTMDLGLKDKVVVVTGGASGIGAACVERFAGEGATACILDRNREAALQLANQCKSQGLRVEAFACELTDTDQIEYAIASIRKLRGTIDCVVNNAGVNDGVGLTHSPDEFRASLERNLLPAFVLVKSCLVDLIASKGTIVNIGSKCARTGQGGTSGYVAAKGALEGLTREWALDLAQHRIRVNCVVPAEVLTPMYEAWLQSQPNAEIRKAEIDQLVPFEHRFTRADEIADTVLFLASARSSHTTGQILYVDGGYTHLDRAY